MSIIDRISNLNANSIAIWYMDDGSIEHRGYSTGSAVITLAFARSTKEELMHTIKTLKEKFDIESGIKWKNKEKGTHRGIKFDVFNTHKLCNVILKSEIGEELKKVMSYKLLDYRDLENFQNVRVDNKTGYNGISIDNRSGRYIVNHKSKAKYVDTMEEALILKKELEILDPYVNMRGY